MSQLGYDGDGEPVELPETAAGWRVSRMKDSGAPALVYGPTGTPVVIPLDADIEALRREVILPGKYRLEAVDEKRRKLGAKFAYVCIPETGPATEPEIEVVPARAEIPSPPNSMTVVLEAMRQNSEMARTNAEMTRAIVDRFPAMMESAAILLKAADGAGLPAREPRGRDENEDEEEEDDDDDEGGHDDDRSDEPAPTPTPASPLFDLHDLIAKLVPVLITAIGNGSLKLPNLADILFWGRESSKKAGRDTSAKAKGAPTAEPAGAADASTKAKASKAEPTTKAAQSEPAAATAEPATEAKVPADAPTDEEMPPLSPQAMAHFLAIQSALTPEEAALARAAAAELSPLDLRAWFDQLSTMTVPEAVERIRALLAASRRSEAA